MNYEQIAEIVHDLIKNPKSMPLQEQELPSTELKTNELTIIQNVFSKYTVSGNALTVAVIPEGMWG